MSHTGTRRFTVASCRALHLTTAAAPPPKPQYVAAS